MNSHESQLLKDHRTKGLKRDKHHQSSRTRSRWLPIAELCVAGSAMAGFLIFTGVIMIILHYFLESQNDFHSLAEHWKIQTNILGFVFLGLAGLIPVCACIAYVVIRTLAIVEMANRYQECQGLCAHEDIRQSILLRLNDKPSDGIQVIGHKYMNQNEDLP